MLQFSRVNMPGKWIFTSGLIGMIVSMLCAPVVILSQEFRATRAWLESYVNQPVPESPRKARYLMLITENSSNYCKIDEDWFVETTDSEEYDIREKTSSVGSLAFCYRTPGLPYYHDEKALTKLRRAFEGVVSYVSDRGKFTWERNLNKWGYDTQQHEHAWWLEPLLLGYIWIKDDLPVDERQKIEAALKCVGRWLYEHPKDEYNNRGIVWASVLTFCGIYFEEPEWVTLATARGVRNGWLDSSFADRAVKAWQAIARKIDVDGTVHGICRGMGIGETLEFYLERQTFDHDPRGLGARIFAGIEVTKMRAALER